MSLDQVARGPRTVRTQILEHLRAELPDQLAIARTEWGFTEKSMPDPKSYEPYDPEIIEDDNTPCIVANVGRTRDFARHDNLPGGAKEYMPRYTATVTVWVKRVRRTEVLQLRDDYVSVVGSLILASPGLGGGGDFRVDQNTLELTYSEAAKLKGDRYLAGGSIAFEVEHTETVRRVPLGDVHTTSVAATVLPAGHPGLT